MATLDEHDLENISLRVKNAMFEGFERHRTDDHVPLATKVDDNYEKLGERLNKTNRMVWTGHGIILMGAAILTFIKNPFGGGK